MMNIVFIGVDLFENDNGTIRLKNGEIATLVGLTVIEDLYFGILRIEI